MTLPTSLFALIVNWIVLPRILSYVPQLFRLPGLMFAIHSGHAMIIIGGLSPVAVATAKRRQTGSLAVILVIGSGVVLGNAELVPNVQRSGRLVTNKSLMTGSACKGPFPPPRCPTICRFSYEWLCRTGIVARWNSTM